MQEAHEGSDTPAIGLEHIAVLIPAWQPNRSLLDVVAALRTYPFAVVLVVDDGSAEAAQPVFAALRNSGIPVLHQTTNLGKGHALKTGFSTLLEDYPGLQGVVTADADGQHTPEDIVRVAQALAANPARLVLGTRTLSGPVPLRSRIGNALTCRVFTLVAGTRLHDTQTGLRSLPIAILPALLAIKGERYEYETAVLVHLCRTGLRPLEFPINTVYLENNRSSHFRPLRDSVRVACVLARFALQRVLKGLRCS
jgi:glycosyltransferase involved in cell wall biosynthesis